MKITLLGDSIRQIGYGTLVPTLLGQEYEVYQPKENCRFSKHTLRGLFDWHEDMRDCEIVHWNNGLWDTATGRPDELPFSTPEEYLANMLRIADYLLAHHRTVIFATTTPVRFGNRTQDNDRIAAYNALVVPELQKKGVIINDLHATVSRDIDKYIREDDRIHLTEEGIRICAEQVCACIRAAADKL